MMKNKANVYCIYQILSDCSDEEHILPAREIASKMKTVYDISLDRRTIYSAIETLILLDCDISSPLVAAPEQTF